MPATSQTVSALEPSISHLRRLWHGLQVRARLQLLCCLVLAACRPEPDQQRLAELREILGEEVELSDSELAELAWQAPACSQAFELSVRYENPPPQEQDSDALLLLAADMESSGVLPPGRIVAGTLLYEGPKVGKRGGRRQLAWSRAELGPGSPTAPCQERIWDPMEDAIALGWPLLPGRLTAVGDTWPGARIEARCNRTACIDPLTLRGGPENHERSCVTPDWEERLLGIFEQGDHHLAYIASRWNDGHGAQGITSERKSLIELGSGRLLWSETVVDHSYLQLRRRVVLRAIDDCPDRPPGLAGEVGSDLAARLQALTSRLAAETEHGRH